MSKKSRQSVLADGTTVDQDHYQSKNYILEQLEGKRGDIRASNKEGEGRVSSKDETMDNATNDMVKSGAVSKDDGWLLASMEMPLRNPFCVANHPAKEQLVFYQKVFGISAVFMLFVALSTCLWTWWWKDLQINRGVVPIMPCKGMGKSEPFGRVNWCNDTAASEELSGGCDEDAPLSVCVNDACIKSEDDIRDCWFVMAFVMVIMAAYMMLLFRRDAAGKGLLSCACFIEGIIGGAATLHYDSSIFVEFFTYLFCATFLCLILLTLRSKGKMTEWESLPNQVGSLRMSVPEVETKVYGFIKINYIISGVVVGVVALMWHFAIPAKLMGGSNAAFFMALITLGLSVAWIIREMAWCQHKFDPDQYVNECISFHVDLYCIFILLLMFTFFACSNACSQGPIGCAPMCCMMMAHQGERCCRFGCGCRKVSAETSGETAESKPSVKQSVHMDKEVETDEQWKKRKMINAGCIAGILALGGMSFFIPHVTFGVSALLCIALPFLRAKQDNAEEAPDTSTT